MIDRLFLSALTFVLLVGGTLAMGLEMFGATEARTSSHLPVYQLQRVVVTGKRTLDTAVAKAAPAAAPAAASRYQ